MKTRTRTRTQAGSDVKPKTPNAAAAVALVALAASAAVGLAGCKKKRKRPAAGPSAEDLLRRARPPTPTLTLGNAEWATPHGPRPEAEFSRGEVAVVRFTAAGFEAPKGRLHLIASLTVTDESGQVILSKGPFEAINQPIPAGKSRKMVRTALKVDVSRASPAGRNRLRIELTEVPTGRKGALQTGFTVRGRTFRPTENLLLARLSAPPDVDLRPGGPLFLSLVVTGMSAKDARLHAQPGRPRYLYHLELSAELAESGGKVRMKQTAVLVKDTLPFKAAALPVQTLLTVPPDLTAGRYRLNLTVHDRVSSRKVSATRTVNLAPSGFGVYGLRLLGSGGVHRTEFYRKERMVARLTVSGYKRPARIRGDVAVEGPDGGIYLLRKEAIRLDEKPKDRERDGPRARTAPRNSAGDAEKDRAGRPPERGREAAGRRYAIPVIVPEFIPTGPYTLHLRLRDLQGRQQAHRRVPFKIQGPALEVLPKLELTRLEFEAGPDRRRIAGQTFVQGQDVGVQAIIGGMRLKNRPGHTYEVDTALSVYVRDLKGKLIVEDRNIEQITRMFTFPPRRLRLRGTWRVPDSVTGWALLQVEVLDRLSDRVSMRQRRILVRPR